MKKTFNKKIASLICILLTGIVALCPLHAASSPLISPALSILSRDVQMIKSGLLYSDITFAPLDFERALGVGKIRSVTINTLPDALEGTLKLGERILTVGETIDRRDIVSMKFVPASSDVRESRFTFSTDLTSQDTVCSLYVLEKVNFAPTTVLEKDNSLYVETSKGLCIFGTLGALDPENDSITYKIVTPPAHGSLSIINKISGDYKYTPDASYVGKDSFSYIARDRYGNYSDITTVTVRVSRGSSLVFADMNEHWATGEAIKAVQAGVIEGRTVGAQTYFYPDEEVTRADFLVMLMKALDISPVDECVSTIFTDDEKIPEFAKGYVAKALSRGYVHGSYTSNGIFFMPEDKVTL